MNCPSILRTVYTGTVHVLFIYRKSFENLNLHNQLDRPKLFPDIKIKISQTVWKKAPLGYTLTYSSEGSPSLKVFRHH